jgi:hypothetical protein
MATRDEGKVQELEKKGIVTKDGGGRNVVDASKLDGPPIRKKKSHDPRRDMGKKVQPVHGRPKKKKKTPPPETAEEVIEEEVPEQKVLLSSDIRKREELNKKFKKEFTMPDENVPTGVGLDIGTSFLVSGKFQNDGKIHFKQLRDCFLELTPKSPVNKKFMKKGLDDRKAPYIEKDGNFYVLGEDAFLMANERHVNTRRPMHRGVLSPQESEAMPILKELIRRLVGEPRVKNEKLIFSVPGKPIDAEFDQLFHQDILRSFIKSLGYDAQPMNEAEALAYSELLEDGLTGISMSCGAGMMNVAVLSSGDPVVQFSTAKSGDWVDKQASLATNMTHSIVQQEKESPEFDLLNPDPTNQIHQAIAVYYGNLIVYTLEQIAYDLAKSPALPKFRDPIPLVIGGGTSLPKGFIGKFEQALAAVNMPVEISEVRHATDPLNAVSNGLTLAASME